MAWDGQFPLASSALAWAAQGHLCHENNTPPPTHPLLISGDSLPLPPMAATVPHPAPDRPLSQRISLPFHGVGQLVLLIRARA